MADLGNIGRSLSRGLLASSGRSGMAAFASIMNTEKRLATASAEASINRATKEKEAELARATKTLDNIVDVLGKTDRNTPEGASDAEKLIQHGTGIAEKYGLTEFYGDAIFNASRPEQELIDITKVDEFGRRVVTRGVDRPGVVKTDASGEDRLTPAELAQKKAVAAAGTEVGAGGLMPNTKTTGTLQDAAIKAAEGVRRINNIKQRFNADFLTVAGKLKQRGLAIAEKFSIPIGKENKQFLSDATNFTVTSIRNINDYIKEVTGAQMSEFEAKRLRRGVPDVGDGVFAGQSPTEFKTTMENVAAELAIVNARSIIMQRKGIDYDFDAPENKEKEGPVTISETKRIINQRGREIAAGLMAQGKSKEEAGNEARTIVQREFGMLE